MDVIARHEQSVGLMKNLFKLIPFVVNSLIFNLIVQNLFNVAVLCFINFDLLD
jgi:hypothetical protein